MANQADIQEESQTISNFIGSCHEQSIHLTWTISFSGTFKQYGDHLSHGDSLDKSQIHKKLARYFSNIVSELACNECPHVDHGGRVKGLNLVE